MKKLFGLVRARRTPPPLLLLLRVYDLGLVPHLHAQWACEGDDDGGRVTKVSFFSNAFYDFDASPLLYVSEKYDWTLTRVCLIVCSWLGILNSSLHHNASRAATRSGRSTHLPRSRGWTAPPRYEENCTASQTCASSSFPHTQGRASICVCVQKEKKKQNLLADAG